MMIPSAHQFFINVIMMIVVTISTSILCQKCIKICEAYHDMVEGSAIVLQSKNRHTQSIKTSWKAFPQISLALITQHYAALTTQPPTQKKNKKHPTFEVSFFPTDYYTTERCTVPNKMNRHANRWGMVSNLLFFVSSSLHHAVSCEHPWSNPPCNTGMTPCSTHMNSHMSRNIRRWNTCKQLPLI